MQEIQASLNFSGSPRRGVMPDLTNVQKFDIWKDTEGGSMILCDVYEITAGFVAEWQRTKIPVSIDYILHIERHAIKRGESHVQKKGIKTEKVEGFTINNTFSPYISSHIMSRRPEWAGLFETRERNNEEE